MLDRAVINSGPLIALSLLGKLEILPSLFREFWIPDVVYQEVTCAGIGKPGADTLSNSHWSQYTDAVITAACLALNRLD